MTKNQRRRRRRKKMNEKKENEDSTISVESTTNSPMTSLFKNFYNLLQDRFDYIENIRPYMPRNLENLLDDLQDSIDLIKDENEFNKQKWKEIQKEKDNVVKKEQVLLQ